MAEIDFEALLGPELASAIAKKGYTALTPVQEAVLDPAYVGRDLRISSQTGSGKTLAIGFIVREAIKGDTGPSSKGAARPRALVVAPTRELAAQVEVELSWLFAPLRVKVAAVTGGGNYRDERRALGSGPAIIVGTPGRLLDHLQRGAIDGSQLAAVVLDEADRMLDLGFRDDLEAIIGFAPEDHRTHLVSATFPREVMALANRVQTDPARIEGTPAGAANADIEHLVHLVQPNERLDAIVNLLLETPDATTLIFARTRADVGELTHLLSEAGFIVDSLSGEMEQRERNKALAAFKRGDLHALVATDVAARGIDVQDVARVLHAEPPMDPDSYTHRSGRTGRAGRKGKSSVLVTPVMLNRVSGLLKRAGVRWRMDPVPTADTIEATREQRLFDALTTVVPPEDPADEPIAEDARVGGPIEADDRSWALAKRIVEGGEGTRALARMIARTRASGPEARRITPVMLPGQKKRAWEQTGAAAPMPRSEGRPFAEHRTFGEPRGLRPEREQAPRESREREHAPREAFSREQPSREPGPARSPRDPAVDAGDWVSFRVSWGQIHGADARRLLAMVCRRGGIRGSDVGAIRVARTFSTVDVATSAAPTFERASREPDPRDPKVKIRPASEVEHDDGDDRAPAPAHAKPKDSEAKLPAERASAAKIPAERVSVKSVKDVSVKDASVKDMKAAKSSARTLEAPADRASVKSAKDVSAKDVSTKDVSTKDVSTKDVSTKDVSTKAAKSSARALEAPADRPSKSAARASEPERTSKRTLEVDRPSRSARDVDAEPIAKAHVPTEQPSKAKPAPDRTDNADKATTAHRAEKAADKTDKTDKSAGLGERPSRSAYNDRRPRPSQPERYSRRPQPAAGARSDDRRPPRDAQRPSHDGPRSYDRARPPHDGPRPQNDRPPYDRARPQNDGPRPPYDRARPQNDDRARPQADGPRPQNDRGRPQNDGPRPQNDGPRPQHDRPQYDRGRPQNDGPRPQHDRARPQNDGPRPAYDRPQNDRGRPQNDGPRPPFDRSRPPHDGPRPSSGGPRPHPGGGGPRPGGSGPRPGGSGPRPGGSGPRPGGPPPSRHGGGGAPPKRKKP
jgi:ATP-dependent RNA helicase DeaD